MGQIKVKFPHSLHFPIFMHFFQTSMTENCVGRLIDKEGVVFVIKVRDAPKNGVNEGGWGAGVGARAGAGDA